MSNTISISAKTALVGVCFFACLSSSRGLAGILLHAGPPAIGGGPSPMTIPPSSIYDYEAVWIDSENRELTLGLYPGILYGLRFGTPFDAYVSVGGGLVNNAQNMGVGIYAAFGYEWCETVCLGLELKEAVGVSSQGLINAYAIRFGATVLK
jgi:hypothetical protein